MRKLDTPLRNLLVTAWLFVLAATSLMAQPTISSFTPTSGPVGTLVSITGTGLANPTSLTIGGVPAIAVSNTGTSLVAMVMPGATSGSVGITTGSGSATATSTYSVTASLVPNTQQGGKLVGTGAVGNASQGFAVVVSADGNTALISGPSDNSNTGAVWVFTRIGGIWSQLGNKLVGTPTDIDASQGHSVSLSADGNTALVGSPGDNGDQGAAWVFTRNAGVWSQQGPKLVGTGAVGNAQQGWSVCLSADGNTAIIGGYRDNNFNGAAWVWTRSSGTWSQQGAKLVGSGATFDALQGHSVSLSADGNTALSGGVNDNFGTGAIWVWTRSGSSWSQQGNKLVGLGGVGITQQGVSVSISADGNTALVGSTRDNNDAGAAWVFTRNAGVWSQQGGKLVGSGAVGLARQGFSVSLSADGNTALVGGLQDDGFVGATWAYTRSGEAWVQQGNKQIGSGAVLQAAQGGSVSLSADACTAMVGGSSDDGSKGAAWVFVNSTTTSTEAEESATDASTLRLFPNPIARSQRLTIPLPDRAAAVAYIVEFVDLAGRIALTQHGELAAGSSEALLLSVSTLAPGTYAVRFTSGGTTSTGRVLVTE